MNRVSRGMMRGWVGLGPRFLPFADAASADLPLGRLLRLSLFQVSVGMALVLLIGTLNRVMIVELGVPASLVGVMIALPLLFAPFRALIGFKSDTHRSVLGWRRVPFMFRGTMIQFGGLSIMPFAILVLAGAGESARAPAWIGQAAAALAFLLVGAGLHTVQTIGLALATDLAPVEKQPKVVGLMYVMLLFGMIASAVLFGLLLADFSPGRLVQVIQGAAVVTIVLNGVALWKQEPRRPGFVAPQQASTFRLAWEQFSQGGDVVRRLLAIGLGTMAFSMEDVLLEPYGGQVLGLTVGGTTMLTATLAVGGLFGFGLASRVLSRGADPVQMAANGVLAGIPAFALVILAAPTGMPSLFAAGTALIGFGAGLFGHGTLTATMNRAPRSQAGLALGAWGAVQATAAGLAIALGGIVRDVAAFALGSHSRGEALAYEVVYGIEIALLMATLMTMLPLIRRADPVARLGEFDATGVNSGRVTSMTQTIVRMYATKEAATGAVKALTDDGFSLYDIHTVFPPEGEASEEQVAAAIGRGHVDRGPARVYARGVMQGGSLVVVNAPFGTARDAIGLLKGFDPIESGVAEPETARLPEWDEAAPFSSAMLWPVLSKSATPFSDALGVPVLTAGRHSMSESLGWAEVSSNPAPLSSAVGLPVLAGSAAPFSGATGLPTLSSKAAPFSEAVGLPVLSADGPDYKPVMGKTLLSQEAAPFSKWLGLPVLWR